MVLPLDLHAEENRGRMFLLIAALGAYE